MTEKNPYIADPTFVHAAASEEAGDSLRLLTFPDGFKFYTHSSPDEAQLIYNEIAVKQEYVPPPIDLAGARCIFDVGANIGVFSLFAKSRCAGATIYAFEPIAETFGVLRRNLELHGLSDVVAANVAVGDADGATKDFTYYLNLAGNSTSDPSIQAPFKQLMVDMFGQEQADIIWQSSTRPVTVRTISSLIREHGIAQIDLLKVDVEGDECAVLRGIDPEHYPLIRQVAMEVHSQENRATVTAQLQAMGFTCFSDEGIAAGGDGSAANVYAVRQG